MSACIADFGISRLAGPEMTKAMGTPRYMAPGILFLVFVFVFCLCVLFSFVVFVLMCILTFHVTEVLAGKVYNTKADVYSFMILLWEILTRQLPFMTITNGWQLAGAVIGGSRPPVPDTWPSDLKELFATGWHADVNLRPSFADIVPRLTCILAKCIT